jgi:hypothetical protein
MVVAITSCLKPGTDRGVALKNKHFRAFLSQHRGRDQSIDAAADDDIVIEVHALFPFLIGVG